MGRGHKPQTGAQQWDNQELRSYGQLKGSLTWRRGTQPSPLELVTLTIFANSLWLGWPYDCVLATRQKWCPPLPHMALKFSYGWPSMFFPTQAGWNETDSPCPCPPPRPSHSSPEQPWEQPVDKGREGGWISESLLRREPPKQEPHIRIKRDKK